jgi:hypothetical protein
MDVHRDGSQKVKEIRSLKHAQSGIVSDCDSLGQVTPAVEPTNVCARTGYGED